MANQIQIKRSSANAAPTGLAKGELAWVDHGTGGGEGCLYIGDMTVAGAVVRTIGGTGTSAFADDILNNTPLTGNPTAPTAAANDNDTSVATTAYVDRQVLANVVPISQASDTNIVNPSTAQVLIYDGTNSWDNKSLSGDVSIGADGTATVNSVANGAVQMATDTDGNFVSAVTAVASETSVNITSGVGNAGDSVAVGLATNIVTQGDLTVGGDLIVSGNSTQVNTNTIELEDPMLVLGDGSPSTTGDRGIEVRYNNSGAQTGFFGLDSTDQSFRFYKTAVINATTNIVSSSQYTVTTYDQGSTFKDNLAPTSIVFGD